jgi:hypothetical protein
VFRISQWHVLSICFYSCAHRSEYIIFQKILKLEYEFPDGFAPLARSIVENLLVSKHILISEIKLDLDWFVMLVFNGIMILNGTLPALAAMFKWQKIPGFDVFFNF